jgi:DNA-binding NarL/FixJ family response regulator
VTAKAERGFGVQDRDRREPSKTPQRAGIARKSDIAGSVLQSWRSQASRPTSVPPSVSLPIRLLLVDDHYLVRMGLIAVLSLEPDLSVVAEADDSGSAVAAFRQHVPDVTLLDVRMPGVDGIETIRQIRAEFADARIIALSTSDLEEDIFRAIEAGAAGYLLKTASRQEVATTIRTVHAGEQAISGRIAARLAERALRRRLSNREIEVLDCLRRGLSNRDIAVVLGVSPHTAKTHVKSILTKLEAADRAEAVAIGFDLGMLKAGGF